MVGSESADCVTDLLGVDHRRLDAVLADMKRTLAAGDALQARARFGAFRENDALGMAPQFRED